MSKRTYEDLKEDQRQKALRSVERIGGRWWTVIDVMPAKYGSANVTPQEEARYYATRRYPWYVWPLAFFCILGAILGFVVYALGALGQV